jgi:hypothetical protein
MMTMIFGLSDPSTGFAGKITRAPEISKDREWSFMGSWD